MLLIRLLLFKIRELLLLLLTLNIARVVQTQSKQIRSLNVGRVVNCPLTHCTSNHLIFSTHLEVGIQFSDSETKSSEKTLTMTCNYKPRQDDLVAAATKR
jgi:hypothetical protein